MTWPAANNNLSAGFWLPLCVCLRPSIFLSLSLSLTQRASVSGAESWGCRCCWGNVTAQLLSLASSSPSSSSPLSPSSSSSSSLDVDDDVVLCALATLYCWRLCGRAALVSSGAAAGGSSSSRRGHHGQPELEALHLRRHGLHRRRIRYVRTPRTPVSPSTFQLYRSYSMRSILIMLYTVGA